MMEEMTKFLKFTNKNISNSGFSLIELMIAMLITTIVASATYTAYNNQQRTHKEQEWAVDMQQNIRTALYMMANEIRIAGYDPGGTNSAGIALAGDGSNGNPLSFTYVADNDGDDNDCDGTPDNSGELETISYDLFDSDGDGDMDIGRRIGDLVTCAPARQRISENIAALQVAYLDGNGAVTTVLQDIRLIRLTVSATVDVSDAGEFNGQNRQMTTVIKCRNLGL